MHKKLIREDIKHLRQVRANIDREKSLGHLGRYAQKEKKLKKVSREIERL